jgi:hypothetical protein
MRKAEVLSILFVVVLLCVSAQAQQPKKVPLGNSFGASLAHLRGNITGLSNLAQEISGKRLELLKEIVPRLSRVAVVGMSKQRPLMSNILDNVIKDQAKEIARGRKNL